MTCNDLASKEKKMLECFDQLNDSNKAKFVEYVKSLLVKQTAEAVKAGQGKSDKSL
jgi:hypothetical protein